MRRPLLITALIVILATPVSRTAAPTAPVPDSGQDASTGTGGETLPPFLARMRQRAAVYRRGVLSFTCTEVLLEEDVAPWTGAPNWRRQATYRYLLQPQAGRGLVAEYRRIISKDGGAVREATAVVHTGTPPPYLWAALLDPDHASLFRFEIIGTEKRGVTDTVIVRFEGQLAYQEGQHMGEWSGRVWVDRDRLDVVHLEAEPAREEAALTVQIDRYRRAFRLAGIPLRKRPRGHTLSIDFLVTHPTGLRFPSRSTWRRQVVNGNGQRGTERMIQRQFTDYGLFDIDTEEIIKSFQQPGPENPPASP